MYNPPKKIVYLSIILTTGLIAALLTFGMPAPAAAQDGGEAGPTLIESDSELVLESGNWQQVEDASASGGSYLLADSSDDVLTVFFEGSSVEILFVRDIDAGSVQIEIDDVVVRTVFSAASFQSFDGRASVDYLDEGVHKLRIYSTDGQVGIDAIRAVPVQPNIPAGLLEKAQEEPVRVVINLRAPGLGSAEALEELDGAEIEAQVDELQTAVLDRLDAQATSRSMTRTELFEIIHQYNRIPALAGYITAEGILALQNHPAVESIDEDFRGQAHLDASRPFINAYEVENEFNLTGRNVRVAVLDSGFDTNHPDLSDSLVLERCFAVDCPGGSAFDAEDEHGHGTHVSGIISSNDNTYRGIAPDAEIVALRVLDATGKFYGSDVTAGLDWLATYHDTYEIDAVNMSIGTNAQFTGNCDTGATWLAPWVSAIAQLNNAEVPLFASSGNNGNVDENYRKLAAPACLSHVIAVGATLNASNSVAIYSNTGPMLDLYAPGSNITSTYIGGFYDSKSGTSMASPTAAGVAALMLEANPFMDADVLESYLKITGVSITYDRTTRSRVDALAAMEHFIEQDYSRQPTYTFDKVSGATWYEVKVHSSAGNLLWTRWFQVGDGVTCGSSVCSVDPDLWVGASGGASNIYWEVRAWDGTLTAWAGPFVKNITAPLHVAPTGSVPYADGFPTFSWYNMNRGELLYRLYIYNSDSGVVFDDWLWVDSYCSGSVCNFELPHEFDNIIYNGSYSWWLQAWGVDGFGPWSKGSSFTQNVSTPSAPSMYYPLDTDTPNPTFNLASSTGHAWFHFEVYTQSGSYVWSGWVSKPEVCGDMDTFDFCQDFQIPVALSDGTDYRYRAQAWGVGGLSPWSFWTNFSINVPTPVNVIPTISRHNGDPTISWPADQYAEWVELRILKDGGALYSEWFAVDSVCGASTCSVDPNLSLDNGSYEVKMRAWGYGGYSPGGYTSTSFDLTSPAPDDPPPYDNFDIDLTRALSDTVTGYDDIYYVWEDVNYVTWYNLQIHRDGSLLVNKWLRRKDLGCSSTCSYFVGTDELLHTDGTYQWKVRGWGPGGLGDFSETATLIISNAQPGQPTLTYPLSTISTFNPTFEWSHAEDSTWQYFVLKKNGTTVEAKWYHYRAPELSDCVAGAAHCYLSLPDDLSNGSYSWTVLPYGPGGMGTTSATGNFTIDVPVPADPSLIYPPNNLIRLNQSLFGYQWSTVSYAVWYYFQVYDKAGNTLHTRWVHKDECSSSSCEIFANLPNGEHYTWRVAAWNYTGFSLWSPERTIHIFE